jgi:glycosyltransferase involved in cell wall biosynthesis
MQTFKDFEWLIVDDGSTDQTHDLIIQWCADRKLDIVHVHQRNSGKHVAFNRAVARARGEFFVPLDSDDTCVPTALERFLHYWKGIPEGLLATFSGVCCHCMDEHGRRIGSPFPEDIVDAWPVQFESRWRISGEKWGFHKTDVLREFPFPEIPGERFVPEGLIWNRIGTRYKMRFVNEALRIYKALPDGLSSSSVRLRANNPVSTCAYYREKSKLRVPLWVRTKACVNYSRFYFHGRRKPSGTPIRRQLSPLGVVMLPIGYAAYRLDRLRH